MKNHPTALLAKLKPLIERRDFADMAVKRYYDMPEVVQKAEAQRNFEDRLIDNAITTWVYRELIEKLQTLAAYSDPGHLDHGGVMAVIEYLQNELHPILREVKDDSRESEVH